MSVVSLNHSLSVSANSMATPILEPAADALGLFVPRKNAPWPVHENKQE
jgi:hypothetical protein